MNHLTPFAASHPAALIIAAFGTRASSLIGGKTQREDAHGLGSWERLFRPAGFRKSGGEFRHNSRAGFWVPAEVSAVPFRLATSRDWENISRLSSAPEIRAQIALR